jgi:hypothetical protein
MEKEQLKRIFDFLEVKGEHKVPFSWKLINNEPLTKEELIVDDDLDLAYTYITSLPEGFEVKGFLDLESTSITSLPEGLKVGGFLNLRFCTELTSLPKGLEVVGDLYVENTELKKYTDKELTEMVKPGFIGRIRKI